jgi:hypothetical protein
LDTANGGATRLHRAAVRDKLDADSGARGFGEGDVSRQLQESAAGDVPASMKLAVHGESRLVVVRFAPGTSLTGAHGVALVGALGKVIGNEGERFGLLADAEGVCDTDGDYRAETGRFFKEHRDTARIALINLGPIIRVVAEMFRIGIGVHMHTFSDETAARVWLRTQGVGA